MSKAPTTRNEPCPCGSGLRYKHCHGMPGRMPDSATLSEVEVERHRVRAEAPSEREATWRRVLERSPTDPEALFHLGNCARERNDPAGAVDFFRRALSAMPAHAGIINNLGLALEAAGSLPDAEAQFRSALALEAEGYEPLANLAQNLYRQKRYAEALRYFDALFRRHRVTHATLYANRGVCQRYCGQRAAAEASFREALEREKNTASLFADYGMLSIELGRFEAAADAYAAARALAPDFLLAESSLLYCRSHLADWRDYDAMRQNQIDAARTLDRNPAGTLSPFAFDLICDDPALQSGVARSWLRTQVRPLCVRPSFDRPRGDRLPLRLGFVSSELYDHPIGRLIVNLLEHLDHARFHVTTYAMGGSASDATAQRIARAVDQFHAMPWASADEVAAMVRADAIDVLVDLNGHSGITVTDVFMLRPAPVQVNFLGYTGTMGTPAYDHILTDRYCIRPADLPHIAERPLYVDPCYLPSDAQRDADPVAVDRNDYGLPREALVLCAFAGIYKATPEMFGVWTQLLQRHPDAILWLRDATPEVAARLRAEAATRGVARERLVFAPRDSIARYLARFRLADLFLDTFPYGAHTTVNDALYAGLPVLTVEGESFAGRASASQVAALGIGMPIARDVAEYHAIADRLCGKGNRAELAALATRTREARGSSALFDMSHYAREFSRAIESAFHERSRPL